LDGSLGAIRICNIVAGFLSGSTNQTVNYTLFFKKILQLCDNNTVPLADFAIFSCKLGSTLDGSLGAIRICNIVAGFLSGSTNQTVNYTLFLKKILQIVRQQHCSPSGFCTIFL
jgi:hypothetical protein